METITIDDRERAGGLIDWLKRLSPANITVGRLDAGDVRIGSTLLIERKTLRDFIESWGDGRLASQFPRLVRGSTSGHGRVLLFLEGDWQRDLPPGYDVRRVREAVVSVMLDWHIPIVQTLDTEDSALWILALASRVEGVSAAIGTNYRADKGRSPVGIPAAQSRQRTQNAEKLQVAALLRIPGLGPARARALLDQFGSIHGLMGADEATLAAIPGIGIKLARVIRKMLHHGG